MEENEVNLIDLTESYRPNFTSINKSWKNNSSFAVYRNNRLNSQSGLFRAPVITIHKSVQTDPPIGGFPATWLVELKSQADSLHEEMANAYNSFVEYPMTNLNEIIIKALAENDHKYGQVSLVDEHRRTLQMRCVKQQSWDLPKTYQRPLNREDRLNLQSREQNLRQSLIQMLKNTTKLKSLISLGLDTEDVHKGLQPTGVTMTSVTQTEPIDTYVKFLQIIDSAHGAMSRDSNSSEEDASSDSNSSDDSSIAETRFTNVHLKLDSGMIQENFNEQSLSDYEVATGQKEDAKNAPSLVKEDRQTSKAMTNKPMRRGRDFRFRSAQENGKRQSFRNLTGAKGSRKSRNYSSKKDLHNSIDDVFEDYEKNFDHQYFGHPEEDKYYSACLNRESTSINQMYHPKDLGFRSLKIFSGEPFLNMDVDNVHRFIDTDRISSINVPDEPTSDREEPSSGIEFGPRTLDGSTIKLRKKFLKNQALKTDKDKTSQIKYTSKDKFYDLIVDADEFFESESGNRYNSQKKRGRSQRKLLPNHPIANSMPSGTEDFEKQRSFAFQDYISDLKRIHNRKPSTERTKEFHKNGSSVVDFDFEDYYQRITNLHSKYRILKDVITRTPTPQ